MRHGLPLTAPSGGANLPYKCPCKGDPGKVPKGARDLRQRSTCLTGDPRGVLSLIAMRTTTSGGRRK
jgi:hypothetical protein